MGWLDRFRKESKRGESVHLKGLPDPVFLGNFLVFNILAEKFGLKEERLAEFISSLPENIQELTKVWIFFYLAWLFKTYANSRYGTEFTNKLLLQAKSKLIKADKVVDGHGPGLSDMLEFWFSHLDEATNSIGTEVNGQEVPFEVFAALAFMALDPGSPFYRNASATTNMVEFDVGTALASAKDEAMKFIQASVDIGRPVEENLA